MSEGNPPEISAQFMYSDLQEHASLRRLSSPSLMQEKSTLDTSTAHSTSDGYTLPEGVLPHVHANARACDDWAIDCAICSAAVGFEDGVQRVILAC